MKKIALITGISGGIGSALLQKFCKNGYFVIGQFCKNSQKIDELKNSVFAENCDFFQCDFSSINNIKSFAEKITRIYPNIDVLINNAGVSHTAVLQDHDDKIISNLITVNLASPIALTREILRGMVDRKKGVILNISSIWGTYGGSCETVYSATKGGLNAFTKALSKEVGLSNVRVNAISCGFVNTKMNARLSNEEKSAFCEQLSIPRLANPDEIADVAYFLCSDDCSYVTGQILGVDGGF